MNKVPNSAATSAATPPDPLECTVLTDNIVPVADLLPPQSAADTSEAVAARATMVARLEESGELSRSPVREALLALPREILLPHAYVRVSGPGADPFDSRLLDGSHPDDRQEWLELIHSDESILLQRDGEPPDALPRGPVTGGRMTSMSTYTPATVEALQAMELGAARCAASKPMTQPFSSVTASGWGAGMTEPSVRSHAPTRCGVVACERGSRGVEAAGPGVPGGDRPCTGRIEVAAQVSVTCCEQPAAPPRVHLPVVGHDHPAGGVHEARGGAAGLAFHRAGQAAGVEGAQHAETRFGDPLAGGVHQAPQVPHPYRGGPVGAERMGSVETGGDGEEALPVHVATASSALQPYAAQAHRAERTGGREGVDDDDRAGGVGVGGALFGAPYGEIVVERVGLGELDGNAVVAVGVGVSPQAVVLEG